jgi:hypothetical protein
MSTYKNELKTITEQELTLFGGLAKVLIAPKTGGGALNTLATPLPWTSQYLKPELKICRLERLKDEDGEYYDGTVEYPFHQFENIGIPSHSAYHYGWIETVWNFAVYRSLEIWRVLPVQKIQASLGGVTVFGAKSLQGKLGNANRRLLRKRLDGSWEFLNFKQTKHDRAFKPFSEEAIMLCKQRAKKIP